MNSVFADVWCRGLGWQEDRHEATPVVDDDHVPMS
jgi:hypothetical protein